MLDDLRDYGLIKQRTVSTFTSSSLHLLITQHSPDVPKPTSRRFSPTRLATTLTSSSPPLPTSAGSGDGSHAQGFIVLETNYRLYAYTGEPPNP